jgi:hypothetical protein
MRISFVCFRGLSSPARHGQTISARRNRTLSQPRAELLNASLQTSSDSLSGLRSQQAFRNAAVARKSFLSGNHAWLLFIA